MNDTIKVGDRVRTRSDCEVIVLGIDGGRAWVRYTETGVHHEVCMSTLTHIEPEPVTLTPKYGVGQRVNFIGQGKVQLAGVEVGYHIEKWGGLWPESLLEPVPTPCPLCKGSGKASE